MDATTTLDGPPNGATRLAALLRHGRGPLIARWCQRVLTDPVVPEAQRLPMPALQNHIPDLIDRLADSLERVSGPRTGEPAGRGVGHAEAAVAHAQDRFAHGYTTESALRELSHFRAALLDLCAAESIVLDGDASLLVHSAIDEAMSQAAIAIEGAARTQVEAVANRLGLATDAAAIGTWDWNVVTDVLSWDPRVRETFGVAPDAAVTYSGAFAAALHPDDRARVEHMVRAALDPRGTGEYHAEHRIVRLSDGLERWVASRARTFFDPAGRPLRLIGTILDITEAKRSETALRVLSLAGAALSSSLDLESTLRTVAELTAAHLADYCLIDSVDEDGSFHRLGVAARDPARNAILSEAASLPPSMEPGSPFRTVLESRRSLLVHQVSTAFLDSLAGHPRYREILGQIAPRSVIFVPLLARERVLGVLKLFAAAPSRMYDTRDLALAEDLARRAAIALDNARLYQEARAALALLDTFMSGAPLGFAVVDRNLRYVRINDTLAALNGVPARDHLGRTVAEVLPTMPADFVARLHGVIETGTPLLDLEFVVPAPDSSGEAVVVANYYPIRTSDGSIAGVGGVVVDITERKRHEKALEREAEFRERIIGIVGHDLRTPLAAITFTASALLKRDEIPEGEARALRRIAMSADRMNRMIGDLLDVTRVRQGSGIPLAVRATDLYSICEQVLDEVSVAYPSRRVDLVTHGESRGEWDADRIAQVVSNLVVNALDYSPAGTPVRVAVGAAEPGSVTLEVHNAGAPIPDEKLATLFDPFKRGTSVAGGRGLGLGLFIAREIVFAHGGSIAVQSDAAAGTTFRVTLPRGARPG